MDTTAASPTLVGARWLHEATVVERLRAAGAVLLGKTTMTEWAAVWSNNAPDGYSQLYGQVHGAFSPDHNPGGSSAGAGVAASLGLAAINIGTETDGSIIMPSDINGIVGIKPTPGLTSRFAVVPIQHTKDTIGPMTRWVKDAAFVLDIIAGKDAKDDLTSTIPHNPLPNYLSACDLDKVRGLRIGIYDADIEKLERDHKESLKLALLAAATKMQELGATVVRGIDLATFRPRRGENKVVEYAMKADLKDG